MLARQAAVGKPGVIGSAFTRVRAANSLWKREVTVTKCITGDLIGVERLNAEAVLSKQIMGGFMGSLNPNGSELTPPAGRMAFGREGSVSVR